MFLAIPNLEKALVSRGPSQEISSCIDLSPRSLARDRIHGPDCGANAQYLVDGLYYVHGNSNGPRLVSYCPGNGLPYPPGGVGAELVSFAVVKLLDSPN